MQRSHGRILQSLLLVGAGTLLASEANAELTFVGNAPTGTTTVLQRVEMRGATPELPPPSRKCQLLPFTERTRPMVIRARGR
jgi:hypothetical protein